MDQFIASKSKSLLNAIVCIIGFMNILGVNMVFRLRIFLMSLCFFTRILVSSLITPIFDGSKKFRCVVSRFRKASPQGDPFPLLILQMSRK